ncbi:Transglutaminase-like superfamily protein [Andreprevotia lacus DSM 23236]|jgi:hypothetical protein|uniref:Transglutaminase-like superfamily protein n=1 Tax=Andreprevotia lacus DSM 23236 TaxID=1121001 RepID=A0A1W1XXG9_9NEIS|nr:transglutaminase family protein [Andreprevotia lacus]SMC28544.1 Transglutaminase-like superfamily protein [Andreprevotia lacus DSM 23236]
MDTGTLAPYLAASEVIDFHHPAVAALARELAADDVLTTARQCFDWVRDHIDHCIDFGRDEVPCTASQALAAGTGFCFAKSHLLVALWRANGIPGGFGYQRLTFDGPLPPHCLHGFAVAHLPGYGWYRCDPRGNKPGISCIFDPPHEQLAFPIQYPGEYTSQTIHAEPLPELVAHLGQVGSVARYRQQPFDFHPA